MRALESIDPPSVRALPASATPRFSSSDYTEQAMSWPQHSGDLTLPSPLGHVEIATFDPSSFCRLSWTSSAPHLAHVMFTLMPHLSQV